MEKLDERQVTIGLPWPHQFAIIETDEVSVADRDVQIEGVVGAVAFGPVKPVDLCATRLIAEIIAKFMAIAIDISRIVRQAAQHIEIRPVPIGRVVEPIAATDMMVGVKPVTLVTHRQTKTNRVARNWVWQFIDGSRTVASSFEAVSIREPFKLWRKAVIKGPAVLEGHRFVSVNAIEAVITVEPGTATSEYIACTALGGMATEAIHVTAPPPFRGVIPIVPGIAVQKEIIRPATVINADGLAIVHGKTLKYIVAAVALEADRLRMLLDCHLDPCYFDALQAQPGAGYVEGIHTQSVGLYLGAVEDRSFILIGSIGDGLARFTALIQNRNVGKNIFALGDLRFLHPVSATTNVDGIPWSGSLLGALDSGKRFVQGSGRIVATIGCHKEIGGVDRPAHSENRANTYN